ncbi:16951_t:CDS:2 [Gigaspora margarita]|uniref:16951_t:CDS:1 n=1 Tax=Gigaspora margarita TaxID=4874 RepID=A0ABM8VZA5_GIGMA|nr:16951_t:CDS:2 [Gigaspora margarita]
MVQNKSDSEQEESYYEEISQNTVSKGPSKKLRLRLFSKRGYKVDFEVKLDNEEECGISYFDSSTTSNLINYLAYRHRIFKDGSCYPSRIIKNQFIRTKKKYELIQQNLILFIIDNSQLFNIVKCRSFQKLLHLLDENFSISCNKTVKTIVSKSFSWSRQQLMNLINNSIAKSWEPKEVLLILPCVLYSNTGKIIAKLLDDIIVEWDLIDKMIAITTNKESNIKRPPIEKLLQLKRAIIYLSLWLQSDKRIVYEKIDISIPMIMDGILEKVKKVLYDSMHKYWQSVLDVGMLACLLDPHFKKLWFANATVIQNTNEQLKKLYELECEVYITSSHLASLSNFEDEDPEASRV